MIRFSCKKCGKSLRANQTIVGRSTRCTACGAINRIPAVSTRKSGEKAIQAHGENRVDPQADLPEEEILTLIADSDSFEGFEDIDLSNLAIEIEPRGKSSSSSRGRSWAAVASQSTSTGKTPAAPLSGVAKPHTAKESALGSAVSSFKFAPRSPSPLPFLIMGGLIAISVVGYLGYRWVFSGTPQVVKTELEKSASGYAFEKALQDLKKAERVMNYMLIAYREKKLPESELGVVNQIREKFRQTLNEGQDQLAEANRLYSSGDKEGARTLLNTHARSMAALQKEIEAQSGWLKTRVYGS
jgi:DNA-directed RNA polymerase subunit RPC12/RpoP